MARNRPRLRYNCVAFAFAMFAAGQPSGGWIAVGEQRLQFGCAHNEDASLVEDGERKVTVENANVVRVFNEPESVTIHARLLFNVPSIPCGWRCCVRGDRCILHDSHAKKEIGMLDTAMLCFLAGNMQISDSAANGQQTLQQMLSNRVRRN